MSAETVLISNARAAEIDHIAADLGVSRAEALEAILDVSLAGGVSGVVRRMQVCRSRKVQVADIRRLVEKDALGVTDAARTLGVSKATISRRLRRFGITPAGRKYAAPRAAEVLAALRQGITTAPEIAAHIGCRRNVVTVALLRMEDTGVVLRGRADSRGRGGRPPIPWRIRPAMEAAE